MPAADVTLPAVRDPSVFSATQVSDAELCLRRWAWRNVDGIKAAPNKYAAHGIGTHAHLERWLKEKALPAGEYADTASAMVPYLPAPQLVSADQVERSITLQAEDGLSFRGFVDLVHVDRLFTPAVTVYDHKTTGDLRYAKTAEELVTDVQATIYAAWAMLEFGEDQVRLRWTYATRAARPAVRQVEAVVRAEDVAPRLQESVETARQLRVIRERGLRALDLPYDASACEAFGGCPYRDLCKLTPQERIQSAMSQEVQKKSFLQRIAERTAAQAAAGVAPIQPPPASQWVNPPLPAAALQPQPQAAPAPSPPQAAPVAAAPTGGGGIADKLRANRVAQAVPPSTVSVPVTVTGQPMVDKAMSALQPVPQAEAPPLQAAPTTEPAPSAAPVIPVEKPARKARAAAQAAAPAAAPTEGYVLYVDCAPAKLPAGTPPPENAADLVERALAAWREETGTYHYKLGYVMVGEQRKDTYGGGPAMFSEGVRKELRTSRPAALVAHTSCPEVRDCLQALVAGAHTVIQG